MLPDPSAPDPVHLLLQHQSRGGSRLRLVGDPVAMLGFCRALRESIATATLTGNTDGELTLPGVRISADYDYHLSSRLTPDLASLLAARRRKARFTPLSKIVFWLIIGAILAVALRGLARVLFGL